MTTIGELNVMVESTKEDVALLSLALDDEGYTMLADYLDTVWDILEDIKANLLAQAKERK